MAVSFGGVQICGSPWLLAVQPGRAKASHCILTGLPPALIAGQAQELVVLASDSHGNRTEGGDAVSVRLDVAGQGAHSCHPSPLPDFSCPDIGV